MKNAIALALSLVLALSLFAGCSDSSGDGATPPANADATSAADAPPASDATPDATPEAASNAASEATPEAGAVSATSGNYSDEMKIAYGADTSPEDGADSVERAGDHTDSPYFSRLDFYNMTSTDTLTILPKYKTIQQTNEWSCGVAAALTVIDYFGKLGDNDEGTLAKLRPQGDAPSATSLDQEIAIFDAIGGFELTTTRDLGESVYDEFHLSTIRDYINDGTPVLICWNDWGGHWQVIIGYDTMGTDDYEGDDVIIVADPYDTTDHNQDGYGVYGAERFIYNFTMYNFFGDDPADNDMLFIAAKAVNS
ncbi:MAG: hypothetical protein LBM98_09195 [Oscillospiraceae bacterium]|nr:hypothetical protein [Oscillospiraceae bacterium]